MKGGIYPLLFFLTSPFKSLNIRIIVDAYRIGKNIDMKIEKLSHIVRKNIWSHLENFVRIWEHFFCVRSGQLAKHMYDILNIILLNSNKIFWKALGFLIKCSNIPIRILLTANYKGERRWNPTLRFSPKFLTDKKFVREMEKLKFSINLRPWSFLENNKGFQEIHFQDFYVEQRLKLCIKK